MIGTTQLLNSNIIAPDTLGLTAETAFTSYTQVASSGQANGTYYFDDGTRTRQYYFDVDGSETGASEGGWARWDASWITWYYGRECTVNTIDSNGLITSKAGGSGHGSSQHSGCGIWANDLFKAQYMTFSDLDLDDTSYASYPMYVTLCASSDAAFPTVNQTQSGQPSWEHYYPGRVPPGSYTNQLSVIEYTPYYTAAAHPNTHTNNNYQTNSTSYRFVAGYKYNLGTKADYKLWLGSSDYSGTFEDGYQPAKEGAFKVWFKF